MALHASDIMDSVAVLLNDTQKQNFTYVALIPHMNIAVAELRELMELNNVNMANNSSIGIPVNAGTTSIPLTSLPGDLVDIRKISERIWGNTNDDFIEMTRLEFLPQYVVQTSFLVYWAWYQQVINLIGALQKIELRVDYVSSPLPVITDPSNVIGTINAQSYLTYRTAALAANFIGENPTRAQALDGDAGIALDRFLGINTKGKQSEAIRRRPFMQGFRNRSAF